MLRLAVTVLRSPLRQEIFIIRQAKLALTRFWCSSFH